MHPKLFLSTTPEKVCEVQKLTGLFNCQQPANVSACFHMNIAIEKKQGEDCANSQHRVFKLCRVPKSYNHTDFSS